MTRKRIGLVLGGGGTVGIAWETGVLAALQSEAGFHPAECAVVAGTSAGAVVGSYAAQGRDFLAEAEREKRGEAFRNPVPQDFDTPRGDSDNAGTTVVPQDILAALMDPTGTAQERAARVGALAVQAETAIDQVTLVQAVADDLGTRDWPSTPFRPTTIEASTGRTVLWDAAGPADLATAVASSLAVPGFFPAIEVEGHHYLDAPRTPFTAQLAAEYELDAVVFVGLDLPILSNNEETEALRQLTARGVEVVTITGGDGVPAIAAELMSEEVRPEAVEVGRADGSSAADAVRALL